MKSLLRITFIALFCNAGISYADNLSSLTLSDAEMQKLKHFFPTEENTHLLWQGDPLEVQLPIAKEKRLVFMEPVTVDVKSALNTDQLRIVNNDKSIYLTALKTFSKTRLYVTLQESGSVVMIDVIPNDNASQITQHIEIKQKETVSTNIEVETQFRNQEPVTYVDLVRFAYQQLYAPDRLLKYSSHYMRIPIRTKHFTSNLIYGDKVLAHPLASWSAGNYYVTAVALQNKYEHATYINIHKDICGDWLAATLYPRDILQSHGDKLEDSTTLFLVSRGTFSGTIGICYGHA